MNICGNIFDSNSFEQLNTCDVENLYNTHGAHFLKHIDGNFAINTDAFACTDYFGSIGLFFNTETKDVFFDSNYDKHYTLPYYYDNNRDGLLKIVFEHVKNTFPLYEESERYRYLTSNLNIVKLPAGVFVNKKEEALYRYSDLPPHGVCFVDMFSKVVVNVLANYSKVNLCLSGGMDSRLIYAVLKNNNIPFRAFAWNTEEGYFVKKYIDSDVILVDRDVSQENVFNVMCCYKKKKHFLSDYLTEQFTRVRSAVGELLMMDYYILSRHDGVFIGGWGRNEILKAEYRSDDVQTKEVGIFTQFNPVVFNSNIFMPYLFKNIASLLEMYTEPQFKNEAREYIENNISHLKHVPYAFNHPDNTISFYD